MPAQVRQPAQSISIHALCEEGDVGSPDATYHAPCISIHALCEEGDPFVTGRSTVLMLFLSTPSARRATAAPMKPSGTGSISIHALCEEGDPDFQPGTERYVISIHALCEEGD